MTPLLSSFVIIAYVALYACAISIPIPFAKIDAHQTQNPLRNPLDSWLQREEEIALEKLLANIAPGGSNVKDPELGVVAGTVIASPSRQEPDYWYQWVRDAAITTFTLVDLYAEDPASELSSRLSTILDAYSSLQTSLQRTSNPSGTFDDLSSLGEPKFHVDGKPFTGSWGRPQRDGPALRAITLMRYVHAYNSSHPELWKSNEDGSDWYKELYDPSLPAKSIIKADLEYVARYWNASGFDLWEEVEGMHFFTAIVQLRALREGAELAEAFGDGGAASWYTEQASYLKNFIQGHFWDGRRGHMIETLHSSRSGLDCGILLGSLHGYPSAYSDHLPIYAPYSDEILVTLLALVEDQRTRFPINADHSSSSSEDDNDLILEGVGLGRYPEDVYDGYTNSNRGGNPWFLCTSSAAEILYRTASHIDSTSNLTISALSFSFYQALLSTSSLSASVQAGRSYSKNDAIYHSVVERLRSVGDEFLEVVKVHADAEGSLSEQFDRVTGFERGAKDLTWSYGAFLQAVKARVPTAAMLLPWVGEEIFYEHMKSHEL